MMRPNTNAGLVFACADFMRQILRLAASHHTEDSAFRAGEKLEYFLNEIASTNEPVSMASTFADAAELLRGSNDQDRLFDVARAGCGYLAEYSAGDTAAAGRLQSRRNDLQNQIRWFAEDKD